MPAQIRKERKPRIPPLTIENAKIVYRNFSGAAKTFNAIGLRNFHIVLEPDQAKELEKVGWNVRWPKPRPDGEERNPTIKVKVRFDNYPPHIVLITKRGRTELDEESVGLLDTAEIESIDLRITGSYNEMETGWKGFTAYLSQMFVTLSENDLMAKHMDMPSRRHSEDD
jgi:hypothetical protein